MSNVYRTPFAYFDLVETFPKPGCAVCNLLQRDVQQFIDNLLFEYANEPGLRREFSNARGMCIEHGLMLKNNKIGNVIGINRLYQDALDDLLAILDDKPVGSVEPTPFQRLLRSPVKADGDSLADLLEPTEGCIACGRLEAFETMYMQMFDRYMLDERFLDSYSRSNGVCLPHFRKALRHIQSPEGAQALVRLQRDIWRSLRSEMALFYEKQNYEHIGEAIGAEGDSWIRAILRLAGERGVFGLRRSQKK
jgi:uncharacterized protein DUF6062